MDTALTMLFGLLGVVALAKKSVDVITWVRNGNWDSVLKTTVGIGAAIGFTFLLAATQFADFVTFTVGENNKFVLSALDGATVLYLGVALGAITAFGVDGLAAVDQSRTSAIGRLIHPSQPEG